MHEKMMHRDNCFVTLTYSDKFLPKDLSLDYRHYQLFMKRLRKVYTGKRIRFYMCGEYGGENLRPHFHACLFGVDFEDKRVWTKQKGYPEFRSKILESIWTLGNSQIGELNFKTAGYCARYICDKVTGQLADAHYYGRRPEFCHMSLKPGIGADWLDKFRSDVYPHGRVVINGKEVNPPRYYDRKYKRWSPVDMQDLADMREFEAYPRRGDTTKERLKVREVVAKARASFLKRDL